MSNKQIYYVKQKLIGLALVLLGVLSASIFEHDITAAILLVPMGLFVMFTKQRVITDRSIQNEEDEES